MLVFLHEMLLKVPTPLIWSLNPYGLAVPSSLIQNSSLVLQNEVIFTSTQYIDFVDFLHFNGSVYQLFCSF